MELFLDWLINQAAVVVVMGMGIVYLIRKLDSKEALITTIRENNIKSIEELNKANILDMKEQNIDIRGREKEQIQTLNSLVAIMDDLGDKIEALKK